MSGEIPKVTHTGVIKVGGVEIRAMTLDNGKRIIPEEDFKKAIKFIGITEEDFELLLLKGGNQ